MGKEFVAEPFWDALSDGGGGGSEPTDLHDVISQSLEGVDRGEDVEGTVTPPVVAEETPEQKAAATEEAELAALEKEILAKNPQMRGNIAVHRHQAVLTRNRNQWTAKEKEYADAKAQHEKDLADWKKYEWAKDPDLREALSALALAETDQKAFAEYLLKDPRFAEVIQLKQQQEQIKENKRPGPNRTTEDGQKYYDEEGLAALLQWQQGETLKAANESFDKRLRDQEKQWKPVVDEATQKAAWNSALTSQGQVLANAREKWSGFKEHEAEIKKVFQEHEDWDLKDAYIAVVPGAYQAQTKVNKEQTRQELIAEMNKKPRAVGLRPGAVSDREKSDEPRDLGDVIREAVAKAGAR